MKCALITGGAGFIGSHLSEKLLREGWQVVVFDNFDSFYDKKIKEANLREVQSGELAGNLHFIEGDIRDVETLNQVFDDYPIDGVFHLAAKAGVRPSVVSPDEFLEVNVIGTSHVLKACAQNGVENFVLGSSSSIYGGNTKIPYEETDPVNTPISPYAVSKRSSELLAHAFGHLYGIKVACLRFFTVYGPRQRPDLAIYKFTERVHRSLPIEMFGDGSSSRDYTHVSDIVRGTYDSLQWLMGQKKGTFEIFNLASSSPISLLELIASLELVFDKKVIVEKKPMQAGDMKRTYAKIEKAERMFQFKPTVKIQDGLKDFFTWFKQENR